MRPRTQILLFLVIQVLAVVQALDNARKPFNPREFNKQVATCTVTTRSGNVVELSHHYVDVNPSASNTSLIMVHGWPSLWSTWSNQIEEFQKDYHLIVPDLRGFGSSTHTGNLECSMADFVGDLVCILEHAKVTSAVCIGHDWGSQICFEAARMRPDIFYGVAGTLPYVHSSGDFVSIEQLVPVLPHLSYQLFFDKKTPEAIAELSKDIRRTIRATLLASDISPPPPGFLTSKDTFLGAWSEVTEIPPVPFFTSEEEDYMVEQYNIQGFENNLHFYMNSNRYASWEFGHSQGNHTIPQPSLVIFPLNDTVADWVLVSTLLKSADFLPQLTMKTLEASHWLQLQKPKEYNAFLREWLNTFTGSTATSLSSSPSNVTPDQESRPLDEL